MQGLRLIVVLAALPPAIGGDELDVSPGAHAARRLVFGAEEVDLHGAGVEAALPEAAAAALERWIERARDVRRAPAVVPPTLPGGLVDPAWALARLDARREGGLDLHSEHVLPMAQHAAWWLEEMAYGPGPLRENLALFWHGHFGVSFRGVGEAAWMAELAEIEREHALGRFDELLRAVARTPAMLRFLDGEVSRREHPNENWARELLELFTLGPGGYTEDDVKAAARAFTGWTQREGRFDYDRAEHDHGRKTVLGVTGILDGEQVLRIVLERPECGRFLARKLLAWLEGLDPEPARVAEYGDALRAEGYDVCAFLRRLVRDPRFHDPATVGTRIASPVVHFVQLVRRERLAPSGLVLWESAAACGQKLHFPPSVQGWAEGPAWVTTDAIVQRDNVAALLLGELPARFWERGDFHPEARGSWSVLARLRQAEEPRAGSGRDRLAAWTRPENHLD